jgi:hypothetical protein
MSRTPLEILQQVARVSHTNAQLVVLAKEYAACPQLMHGRPNLVVAGILNVLAAHHVSKARADQFCGLYLAELPLVIRKEIL